MNPIYIVVSLPKSGTTSLCKMANICGLKSLHVLKNISFIDALDQGYNFFADTPFYSPEFLICMLELGLQEKYNIKFVYSHRKHIDHEKSLKKMYSGWIIPNPTNKIFLMDYIIHNKLKKDYNYKNHLLFITKITQLYNIPLLNYNFQNGWQTFCSFINKPVPNHILPHLNKSSNA